MWALEEWAQAQGEWKSGAGSITGAARGLTSKWGSKPLLLALRSAQPGRAPAGHRLCSAPPGACVCTLPSPLPWRTACPPCPLLTLTPDPGCRHRVWQEARCPSGWDSAVGLRAAAPPPSHHQPVCQEGRSQWWSLLSEPTGTPQGQCEIWGTLQSPTPISGNRKGRFFPFGGETTFRRGPETCHTTG